MKNPTTLLNSDLHSIKDKEWKELQKWCRKNKDNKFTNEKDKEFQRFQEYCTWKIGDKLPLKIPDSIGKKRKNAHRKLKTKKGKI